MEARGASGRLGGVDALRGIVMVLMALDHARWFLSSARFSPTDLERTTAALFLTRWVTHFCAPAFLFLAGASAFLYGRRRSKRDLARFLVTRGLWLIVVEMTAVRFGWFFNFDYRYLFGGILWTIGWCMVLLAPLVLAGARVTGGVGIAIVAFHDLLGPLAPTGRLGDLWTVAYRGGSVELAGIQLEAWFTVLPWLGVLALGHGCGALLAAAPERRDRRLFRIGLSATALFVLLRAFDVYGDPRPWSAETTPLFTLLSFVNTTKYPPSLLFLLMTLGPSIALLPWLERWRGPFAEALRSFGRVPFFFYVLHLPAIHLLAAGLSLARSGEIADWLLANPPPAVPEAYGYGLAGVYAGWIAVVALLYPACRWFAAVKARGSRRWLSYL